MTAGMVDVHLPLQAVHMDASGQTNAGRRLLRSLGALLPDWFWTNVRSRASLKKLARAWVAAWATVILMLPNASLRTMGNTAFFAMLMATALLPASLPTTLFAFQLVIAVCGTCTGWAIGVVAMRAALTARDKVLLQTTLLKAKESAAGLANPDAVFQADIFQGIFLDSRSSIVFGIFLGFGVAFLAFVRARIPALTVYSLLGTVALDIMCSIGPLLPTPNYLILTSLLIAVGMYAAIAFFLSLFMFPETINSACLSTICRLLGVFKGALVLMSQILDDPQSAGPKVERLTVLRTVMFKLVNGLKLQGMLLNAEFSWGRLSGTDVAGFQDPLTAIATRLNALLTFLKISRKIRAKASARIRPTPHDIPTPSATESETNLSFDPTSEANLLHHWSACLATQEQHHLSLGEVVPVLKDATRDIRGATIGGIAAVQESLEFTDGKRFRFSAKNREAVAAHERRLDEAIEGLRTALDEFKASKRLELLLPFKREFKDMRFSEDLPSLNFIHVYSASLILVAELVLSFMELVAGLFTKRTQNRLWAPKSLRDMAHAFASHDGHEEEKVEEDDHAEVGGETFVQYRHDPDRKPAKNPVQKIFAGVQVFHRWLSSAQGLFVVRYVVLSIAMWLPAVFRPSAHFYYQQKGVWALIMSQFTLGLFLGDQVFIFVTRVLLTFTGAVIALCIWYIGNGHGTGNPYGLAASAAVILVPLLFIRIFAPFNHMPLTIILNATVTLVIGYSWIDGHLSVISIGIGWGVAWRRMLLVMIGCTASFIIMFVPPKSARKAVRVRNAAVMNGISNVYLSLTSAWVGSNTHPAPDKFDSASIILWQGEIVAIAQQLLAVDNLSESALWEGRIFGQWHYEEYKVMREIERDMLALMVMLGSSLNHMNSRWRARVLHQTQIVSPNFLSDFSSLFTIVSHSLRLGEPIHTVVPHNLMDKLLNHQYINPDAARERHDFAADVQEYDYLFYLSAVIAGIQLATCLDELHSITRRLCGEVPFRGFEEWIFEHHQMKGGPSAATSVRREKVGLEDENGSETSEKR